VQSYVTNSKTNTAKIKYLKQNTKMIIFDMDGTIADTSDLELKLFAKILGKNKKYYKQYFGPPSKEIIQKLNPNWLTKKVLLYNHLWETEYLSELKKKSFLFKDTKEILLKLKTKYKLGIITSSVKRTALITLKDIYPLFDFVLCANKYTKHKPNPESLNLIIKKYDLKPNNIIYIGDNINDITFGKNAKTKTIGKIDLLYSKKDLEKYNPNLIINNLSDLKCLL
jgi:HAD superfamily hydrolase (TIGR01549 family)